MFRRRSIRVLPLLLLTVGCGDASDTPRQDASTRGTALKGEACTVDDDCAEPTAKCRKGDVCTGPLDDLAFETECTRDSAADCAGFACLVLKDNVQNKSGICTLPCVVATDCGGNAACVDLGSGRYCVSLCTQDSDCRNGFVCIADPAGSGDMGCLVQQL